MSVADRARAINYFAQASFINMSGAVEKIHQKAFEVPVDVAQNLGYSPQKADMIKSTHKRVLSNLHSGLRSAVDQLGTLMVNQVGEVQALVNDLAAMSWQEKTAKAEVRARARKPAQKVTSEAAPAQTHGKQRARGTTTKPKTSKKKGAA